MRFRTKYIGFNREEAESFVEKHEARGGIAWVTEDRSSDPGHPFWWGYNVNYFTAGQVKKAGERRFR